MLTLAGDVQAQEPRPAPGYFVDIVMATTTAQQLALSCPSLSFDIVAASRATEPVVARLAEDGFDPDQLDTQITGFSELIADKQAAFVAKHGLAENPGADAVCAAGAAEIAASSDVGAYLLSVTP
nr:DUF5333 family protein [Actibacterium sp. 188UL27-1]